MNDKIEDLETDLIMDRNEQDNSSEEIIKVDKKRIKNKRKLRISESDDDDEINNHECYSNEDSCSQNYSSWVQCDNAGCQKWRKIDHFDEDEEVTDGKWICGMNNDEAKNTCEASQETIPTDNEESCYTNHKPGNILWGKINGYPWWPCMVENDPDYKTFYWNYPLKAPGEIKTSIHVTFVGEDVSRAWLSTLSLRSFTGDEKLKDMGTMTFRKTNFKHAVVKAIEDAKKCLELTIKERLLKYGFKARYDNNNNKSSNQSDDYSDCNEALHRSKTKRKKQQNGETNDKPKERKRKKITEGTKDKPEAKKKAKKSNKDAAKNGNSNSILCQDEVRKALSCIKYDVKEDENEDRMNSNNEEEEDVSRTIQDKFVGESYEDDEDDIPALVQPHIVQIDPVTYCVEYPILGRSPCLDENDEDLKNGPGTALDTTKSSTLESVVNGETIEVRADKVDNGQDQLISKEHNNNSLNEMPSARQNTEPACNVDETISSDSKKSVNGLKNSKADVSKEKASKRPKIIEKAGQNIVQKDKGGMVSRSKGESLKSRKEKPSTADKAALLSKGHGDGGSTKKPAAEKKLVKKKAEEKKMEEKKMKKMEEKKMEENMKEKKTAKEKTQENKTEEKKTETKKIMKKKMKEKRIEEEKKETSKDNLNSENKEISESFKEKEIIVKDKEEDKIKDKKENDDSKRQEDGKINESGKGAKKKQHESNDLAEKDCTEEDKNSLDSKDKQPNESSLNNDRSSKGRGASSNVPSEKEKSGDVAQTKSKQQTTPIKMKPKKNTFAVPRKKASDQNVQLQVKSTNNNVKREMFNPKTDLAKDEVSTKVDSSSAKDTIVPSIEPKEDMDGSTGEGLGQTEKIADSGQQTAEEKDSASDSSKTSDSSREQNNATKISAKSPKKSKAGDNKRKSKKIDDDLSDDDVCYKIEKTILKPKQTKMSRLSKIAKQYEGAKSMPSVKTSPKPLKSKESSMFMLAMESQMHHSPNKKKALFSPKQKKGSMSQLDDNTNVVRISAIVESYCDDEEKHSQTKEEKPFMQFENSPNLNFREIEDKMSFPSISSPPMDDYMGNQEVPECENTDPVMPVVKEINALIDDSPEF